MSVRDQDNTNIENRSFWDEMCGTSFAQNFDSLESYDAKYFEFYPYLARYVDFASMQGRDVLEVGLGYGTVAQRIMESGARYTGLDIADGPVKCVNYRIQRSGFSGRAQQGSILSAPFEDASFDAVVAIGCYHHTGDLLRAIAETRRLLRKNGRAMIMVYNAASYMRWLTAPKATAQYVLSNLFSGHAPLNLAEAKDRAAYDVDTTGAAAPETVLMSSTTMGRALRQYFSTISIASENVRPHRFPHILRRSILLKTVGRMAGLDIYCNATV